MLIVVHGIPITLTFSDVGIANVVSPSSIAAGHHEGKDSQYQDIENANNGQDVSPADAAVANPVRVCIPSTDACNMFTVPTSREDDTAQKHA